MTNNFKNKSGFTLIELMVVMAIIGILMTLGLSAFINTRRSRSVYQAASVSRDAVKNARASSLSVASPDPTQGWPFAYEVLFRPSSIETNALYTGSSVYQEWDDSVLNTKSRISQTDLHDLDATLSASVSECNRVVFSSVNGAMYIYNGSTEVSSCRITFLIGSESRDLVLNSQEKQFEIEFSL